jgi:hypothetical protein
LAVGVWAVLTAPLFAQPAKTAERKSAAALPLGTISAEMWQAAPTTPLGSAEIDQLVGQEVARAKVKPAPLTTDDQFLRRVRLDLTGSLPMPADVKDFLADRRPNKRALLIDKLFASDDYARHWAEHISPLGRPILIVDGGQAVQELFG